MAPAKGADPGLRAEFEALRQRVEVAEAVLEIQSLKARYGELVDQRLVNGAVVPTDVLARVVASIVELFTEDAVWDGGPALGVATGREAIAQRLSTPTTRFSRHLFVKPRIEVRLPEASARWDLLCPCTRVDGRSFWMTGYEDDEYRLDGGTWRHSSMKLTTVRMAPAAEGFGTLPA